jgi:hypothetical protein
MKEAFSKSLVEIDLNRLDEEWARQPGLMLKYASKLAEAKLDHAEAKASLKLIQAKVGNYVRKNPKKYGVTKPTKDSVDDAVTCDQRVLDAVSALNQSAYTVDQIEAQVDAVRHRKATLEDEVYLFGLGYMAEPRIPKGVDSSGFKEQRKENARQKVRMSK